MIRDVEERAIYSPATKVTGNPALMFNGDVIILVSAPDWLIYLIWGFTWIILFKYTPQGHEAMGGFVILFTSNLYLTGQLADYQADHDYK